MGLVRTQVTIVGGGMVGAALAVALAVKGKKVVVLERSDTVKTFPTEPSLRVSALNLAAQNWFAKLGVWELVNLAQQGFYDRMEVWDDATGAKIQFAASAVDQEQLGCIVENAVVEAALWQRAQALGVQFELGVEIEAIESHTDDVVVQTKAGTHYLSQLLIAADGGRSQVRSFMNVEMQFRDYEQLGVVATLNTEYPHEGNARQVFLAGGPLALLPMADPHQVSIVWSLPTLEAQALLQKNVTEFAQAVTAASSSCLGVLTRAGEAAGFPLRMQYAEQWLKQRIVLVGDAWHTLFTRLSGAGVRILGFSGLCFGISADPLNALRPPLKRVWDAASGSTEELCADMTSPT